eukprot:TRINITY_DN5879_c0_g1_i1.p1 TRINITY_DN5879_c0_g1~~TRINITY_DN5879_c0_g1_i1.p1  ORF type:complete len:364 (+),score=93.51 TRINITY_DN5879_c0_g1_i1:652-1743(+)
MVMRSSGSGEVTGTVFNVNNFGCAVDDYTNYLLGNVALVIRGGDCTFKQKIAVAAQLNVTAVLVYNEASYAGPVDATAGNPNMLAFGLTYAIGYHLHETAGAIVYMKGETVFTQVLSPNLIAEINKGSTTSTIVVGAHIDSRDGVAGINDNGSGTAALLEIAVQLLKSSVYDEIKNHVVFGWWTAEEGGLHGSRYFVQQRATYNFDIAATVNLDMLASPNYAHAIFTGSSAPGTSDLLKTGCTRIEQLFTEYCNLTSTPYVLSKYANSSDYGPFVDVNIPANGIEGGAGGLKNVNQRAMFGGLANTAYDPCYHTTCDTLDNINYDALAFESKATDYVVKQLSIQTELKQFLASSNCVGVKCQR